MNIRRLTLSSVFVLALVGAAVADPVELPSRRPGYWEISIGHGSKAAFKMTVHACIDAATDKAMMEAGTSAMDEMCSDREVKREGDAWIWDTKCTMGPMKTSSHMVITGDFQSAYQMEISSDVTGLDAPEKTVMTHKGKWLSEACPAGVKPGDMQMPGGITINAGEMIDSLGVAKTPWQP
ncbi:DUF3617 domain-containing protein [Hyphomicrobium sp.]|uniref:DUF3617 domain-containing protein n=1 Tax=Hyphomicrobium sp. TaxID=82 RepID=UPI002D79ED8D|nr:DUF3617 family protein [Hyphomicrobium sp.]HET6390101.1 DUF3617 family protein [Hyphomicrobium sp.]